MEMNEQNMLEKFFIDKEDYIDFLVSKKQLTREIEDGTILADLKRRMTALFIFDMDARWKICWRLCQAISGNPR